MRPYRTDPVSDLDGAGRRILVLGTTVSSRVAAVASRTLSQAPVAAVTVCVPEVETWKFRDSGFEVLALGEGKVPFDSPELRSVLETGGFDGVVLPLSVPRDSLLGAARMVALVREQVFVLSVGPITVRWRPAILAALVLFTVVAWFPLKVLERVCGAVDGVGVIAGGLAARLIQTRRADKGGGEVCHVIPSLGTGGTQRQVVEYLKHAGSGPPLFLIALFDYNDRFLLEVENAGLGVEILARRCRSTIAGRIAIRFFPNSTALIALWRRLRSISPACVVSWLFQANVLAAPAARLAGIPSIVSSIRNLSTWKSWPEYRRWWYRQADRSAASLSDAIFANSRAAADDYARWLSRETIDVKVIPNGLDLVAFVNATRRDPRRIHNLPPGGLLLLAMGRLSAEKDHVTLLRALALLSPRCPDWHLMVVGHGGLESSLRELVSRLDLEDHVTFVGRVDDPQSYFAAADLFILPSRIEGSPNALIEAQAFGLATVTTNWDGVEEVVTEGETAVVVPVGDAHALATEIERLLADGDLRLRMGRSAVDACRKVFDITTMVEAIDRISGRAQE